MLSCHSACVTVCEGPGLIQQPITDLDVSTYCSVLSRTLRRANNDLNADYCGDRQRRQGKEEMNRFLRAGENGGLLTDCRELSPSHTASSSSSSSSSISITSSSSSAAGSADIHAALPSLQTRGPGGGGGGGGSGASELRRSALKRGRAGREGQEEPEAPADHSAAAASVRGGGGEVCQGVNKQQRREAQGRRVAGEGLEMISAVSRDADVNGISGGGSGNNNNNNNGVSEVTTASPSATCAKGKEERKGKNVIRGWKRERDRERDAAAAPPAPPVRTRKEKPGEGSSPPPSVFLPSSALTEHHLCRDGPGHCRCAAPDSRIMGDNNNVNNNNNSGSNGGANKNALDCGVKSGGGDAIVIRRQHDDTPAAKKHRGAEKVSSFYCLEANNTTHPQQEKAHGRYSV